MPELIKVFISYTTEDYEMAKKLYDDLKKAGVDPWLDREDLLVGENWKNKIYQVIQKYDYCLMLLSSKSVSKVGFVQKEIRIALDKMGILPPNKIFIIPVRLDDCKTSYEELQELQWVDLFPNYDEGLEKIFKRVKFFLGNVIKNFPNISQI